jgi:predicted PurR-regulated permease PerM
VKKEIFGYIALVGIIVFLVFSHLISLTVYFLFLYLFTDVFVNDLNRRFPFISKKALFWAFLILILAAVGIIVFKIIPLFSKDLPGYFSLVREKGPAFLSALAASYGLTPDVASVKEMLFSGTGKSLGYALKIFNNVSKEVVYILFAFVLNLLFYLEKKAIVKVFALKENTLLFYLYDFCVLRLKRLYGYFKQVMIGQFFISLINTAVTLCVVFALGLPNKVALLCIIFLCGLLPVVGNLISNSILSVTALITNGIPAFLICLGLLIALHKLEYFLNGKIIGSIIRLPMFMTVMVLLAGEATLGVFGMVLAVPFFLALRDEADFVMVRSLGPGKSVIE